MQLVKDEDSTDLMSRQFLYGNHLFNKKKAIYTMVGKKSKTNLMKHQLLFYTAFFH